jgi:hypothetical protein
MVTTTTFLPASAIGDARQRGAQLVAATEVVTLGSHVTDDAVGLPHVLVPDVG